MQLHSVLLLLLKKISLKTSIILDFPLLLYDFC